MNRKELIQYCLSLKDVYEDYPFDKEINDDMSTAIRHLDNKRIFALIYESQGRLCVNVKCDPSQAAVMREIFEGITPGWHMNKKHWNTLVLGLDVEDDLIKDCILHSYELSLKRPINRSVIEIK